MKMPDKIDITLFARCGANCMVCYKHVSHKNACPGCRKGYEGKPTHCLRCGIVTCVRQKRIALCFECPDFPCIRIKNLERSYQRRYGESLIKNSTVAKEKGLQLHLYDQRNQFCCPSCKGVVSLQDAICSECGQPTQERKIIKV